MARLFDKTHFLFGCIITRQMILISGNVILISIDQIFKWFEILFCKYSNEQIITVQSSEEDN
jgi:hypothetical protein